MSNCFNCYSQCNKLCPNFIVSTSLTVVTVNGTDTLLIDIPTGTYGNGCTYCIIIAQNRPSTATVDMPVAISIGGNTTTVYPLVCNRTCLQANACQISGHSRLKVVVQTNTTGGVFRVCSGLGSCCYQKLRSLPAPTTTTPATAEASITSVSEPTVASTKTTKTTAKKEVVADE